MSELSDIFILTIVLFFLAISAFYGLLTYQRIKIYDVHGELVV